LLIGKTGADGRAAMGGLGVVLSEGPEGMVARNIKKEE